MIILGVLILLFLFFIWAQKEVEKQKNLSKDLITKLNQLLDKHKLSLARQRKLKVQKDEYGNEKLVAWNRELEYFFTNVLMKDVEFEQLFQKKFPHVYGGKNAILMDIDALAKENLSEVSSLDQDIDKLSPIEFENFCADILLQAGWNATVTQASGDQGVDVIAEKKGIRLVLQCKKYSSPVGNKAVQEIAAGKIHQQADHAAVVTNNGFTPSALELANTTNVKLLHVSELEDFAKALM